MDKRIIANKQTCIIGICLLIAITFAMPVFAVDSRNVFSSAIDSISSYWGGPSTSDKVQGWFYQLEPWEVEVCSSHVTTDLRRKDPTGFDASTSLDNIYGDTATILAQKRVYAINETMYELNWYVQPKAATITYAIYVIDADGTIDYVLESGTADVTQGDVGFIQPFTSAANYTTAVIEYKDSHAILWKTKIIPKPTQR